jgi:hypothetical protein
MTSGTRGALGRGGLASLACALVASAAFGQLADVGLSTVRAQRFGRPEMTDPNTTGGDRFASSFAIGDFDGDGADDLATGAPESDGASAAPVDKCGAVHVRYGVAGAGLDAGPATVLGQFVSGGAAVGEKFGSALAACDLNGDNFDDLVVGVPYQTVTVSLVDLQEAGVVQVFPGSPTGLPTTPSGTLRQPGTGLAIAGSHFGAALACGDFDGDGFDDLAVGAPERDLSESLVDAGRVVIYPGSASGIGANPLALDQDSPGMVDQAEASDHFGAVLTTGDFDGDGFADLAVGIPSEATTGTDGAFQVIDGASKGLGTAGNAIFFSSTLSGDDDASSGFGWALAAGDFDADGYDDLAVGSPLDAVLSATNAGTFVEVFGSSAGLTAAFADWFDQDHLLGGGESAESELFGAALAAGDFDGDGTDDLAVGSPYEDVLGTDDGAVTIVMGLAGAGLSSSNARKRKLEHGLDGVPGEADEDDLQFGFALACGDFDGDGSADLVIGAPNESESFLAGVGTATILYGALFADGFEDNGHQYWSFGTPL